MQCPNVRLCTFPQPRKRAKTHPFLKVSVMNFLSGSITMDNRPHETWSAEDALKKCPHALYCMSESPGLASITINSNSREAIVSISRKNFPFVTRLVSIPSQYPLVQIESMRRLRHRERSMLSGTPARYFRVSLILIWGRVNRVYRLGSPTTS